MFTAVAILAMALWMLARSRRTGVGVAVALRARARESRVEENFILVVRQVIDDRLSLAEKLREKYTFADDSESKIESLRAEGLGIYRPKPYPAVMQGMWRRISSRYFAACQEPLEDTCGNYAYGRQGTSVTTQWAIPRHSVYHLMQEFIPKLRGC